MFSHAEITDMHAHFTSVEGLAKNLLDPNNTLFIITLKVLIFRKKVLMEQFGGFTAPPRVINLCMRNGKLQVRYQVFYNFRRISSRIFRTGYIQISRSDAMGA